MKILVDEMPVLTEDCPWSSLIKDSWNNFWFCNWRSRKSAETCPMATGGECPYFTTISQQTDLDCIIDTFNAVPETYQLLP